MQALETPTQKAKREAAFQDARRRIDEALACAAYHARDSLGYSQVRTVDHLLGDQYVVVRLVASYAGNPACDYGAIVAWRDGKPAVTDDGLTADEFLAMKRQVKQ